ncbi:MAG: PucR family transcriptional regulator ligand-binding domain-containing protein [Clostridium cadaveris]|uniref:PucR family transcriptional regulator n=1 Tax=Clostridium cadaveris TaxID=1529 RepID=UPI002A87F781|nr:PucR family transcriptional regulator ligand-binding domain-containing protein [Clostridium cadaveris]
MSLTIRDALNFGGLKKCQLVAGSKGLSNIILHTNSMEIPDIEPWLTKGELLVTTGYALKSSSINLIDLINIVYRTHASGIAIKTRFIGPFSKETIDLADELGVPLIEMPDDLPFVEVLTPLMKSIMDEHHSRLEYSQTIHNKFIDLELNGGGFSAISSVLYTLLKLPNAIVDSNFEIETIKSSSANHTSSLNYFCNKLLSVPSILSFKNKPIVFYRDLETNTLYKIRKISNKDKIHGYLILEEDDEIQNEMADIIIDHATTAIALEFSKKTALDEQMKLIGNHFYLDIIAGNIKNEEEAKLRAFNLKWPSPPLRLAIFDVDQFDTIIKNKDEFYIQELKELILNTIRLHLKALTKNFSIIPRSDSFTCLLPHTCKKEELSKCINNIQNKVQANLHIELTVGISVIFDSYTSLHEANKDAREAIKISRLIGSNSRSIFIENNRLEQALLQVSDNDIIQKYIYDTIFILKDYDKKNGSQLLETLNQLILCMGIKTQAAQNLFLHRNTLMYRIKKIEHLTGYNLSDKNDLLSLAVAMKFYPFVAKNKIYK